MEEKFVALVGIGYWGKNLFRNLYELGVLHTIYDSNPKVVREYKSKFPEINLADSFESLLNHSAIKAVVIATPAITHYELTKKALLAGKDVFVEKPLSLMVSQGEELVALAEEKEKILMVGHILQYHPAVIKLKELIDLGELGKIYYIYSNRLNIGKLRTEENILWSFAPHDISVILMLTGEEPVAISAFGGDYINKGIYDTTLTTLEFKSGIKGHIFVSWLHPYKEQKLIVVGSKAMAVFDDVSKEKLLLYPHKIQWLEGKIPIAEKADSYKIEVENREPLREELKHFLECIKERKTPRTDGKEALRVLKILQYAEESLKKKGERILLSPPNDKKYFVHESSYVDEDVIIGEGTKIWHFSHILRGTKIGKHCVIGQNCMIGPDVSIGAKCKIQNNVSIFKGVTLEDEVFCGPSCVFTNVSNPRAFIERKQEFKSTLVKKGATIGANATIICGVTIGRYAMVGAGALVNKDVPDYALVVGVPARQIGWVCKCGTTLSFDDNHYAVCKYCGNEYKINEEGLEVIKEV